MKIFKCILAELVYSMLPDNDIKEELSKAYVQAICSMAGYGHGFDPRDLGVDIIIKDIKKRLVSNRIVYSGYNLGIQLKSTTISNCRENATHIAYDLRNKNYNDLADTDVGTKRILVLFILPNDKPSWLVQDIQSLILKKCAYWFYLEGQSFVVDNDSTTAIHIPKENLFSIRKLRSIMDAIKSGANLNGI